MSKTTLDKKSEFIVAARICEGSGRSLISGLGRWMKLQCHLEPLLGARGAGGESRSSRSPDQLCPVEFLIEIERFKRCKPVVRYIRLYQIVH